MALLTAVLAVAAPGVCPAQEKTMEMATLTAFATRYAENGYLRVNDGESAVGRAEIEPVARDFMSAVPDMIVRLVELRQDNDRVIFHGHWTGTSVGPGGTENAVGLTDCESDGSSLAAVGKAAGFSLHAGVAAQANREKLEGLCRYITGPAVSAKRMSLTHNGEVRYELKTPWRNGMKHIIFDRLDFMYRMRGMSRGHGCAGAPIAKLVSLIPRPRVDLTRCA